MARNILVIVSDETTAATVHESLTGLRDGCFDIEHVGLLQDGLQRVASPPPQRIAAVIVDLFLPDSAGIDTFDRLFRAVPHVPILVISNARDEEAARQAIRHGADDYLLAGRIDRYSLAKAIDSMLERAAYAGGIEAQFARAARTQGMPRSMEDAVVTIDIGGHVTSMNPVAESMTGWSQQDALGRPLLQVLRIIDAGSRKLALNPLAMAILHDGSVRLSEHGILVRRDGLESTVEDTATVVRDRHGRVTGAVIVFHDTSPAQATSFTVPPRSRHESGPGQRLGSRMPAGPPGRGDQLQ